jgi:hypothetical protein
VIEWIRHRDEQLRRAAASAVYGERKQLVLLAETRRKHVNRRPVDGDLVEVYGRQPFGLREHLSQRDLADGALPKQRHAEPLSIPLLSEEPRIELLPTNRSSVEEQLTNALPKYGRGGCHNVR